MLDPQKLMEEILQKQGKKNPFLSQSMMKPDFLIGSERSELSKMTNVHLLVETIDKLEKSIYITPGMECIDLNWTEKDMLLPLFRSFMIYSKSIIRFEQIYNTDPEYYFEKLKNAYPDMFPQFGPLVTDSFSDKVYSWYLQKIKAFAVHFSEKPEDLRQLERFYTKSFQKLRFSFPDVDRSQTLNLSPFVMVCVNALVDREDPNFSYLFFAAIRYLISVAIHRGYSIKIGDKPYLEIAYALCDAQFLCDFTKDFPIDNFPYDKMLQKFFAADAALLTENAVNNFGCLLGSTNIGLHEHLNSLLENKNSVFKPIHGDLFFKHVRFFKEMISCSIEKILVQEILLKKEKEKPAAVITEKAPEPELSELVLKKHLSEATDALSKSKQKSDELSDLLTETKSNLSKKNDLIKELRKRITELEKDLEDTEDLLLKEALDEEEDDTSLADDELEFLNSCRIVVVGGHDHLQKQLSDRVPNIRFIDPNCSQVDYNLIRNADIVSFITNHCSHSIYQRVKQQAKLNKKKLSHHNSNHANFICRTILNELLAN